MWTARSRLASSMNGRFSASAISFHSAPSRLEISELCILGFSWAILRRWPRDHTMNAFIGRLTRSASEAAADLPPWLLAWTHCDYPDMEAVAEALRRQGVAVDFRTLPVRQRCNDCNGTGRRYIEPRAL